MLNVALLVLALTSSAVSWQTFTVAHTPGQDDTPALAAALATGKYSNSTTILFEKGITYNIYTPISFPVFNNVEVAIEGNLTYPDSIATVQGKIITTFRTDVII